MKDDAWQRNISAKKVNKRFGIMQDGKEVVPCVHDSKESAIEEWVCFERLNTTGRQFLEHKRTLEEIDSIASYLNS